MVTTDIAVDAAIIMVGAEGVVIITVGTEAVVTVTGRRLLAGKAGSHSPDGVRLTIVGLEASHEKHRGRSRRDHRQSNG